MMNKNILISLAACASTLANPASAQHPASSISGNGNSSTGNCSPVIVSAQTVTINGCGNTNPAQAKKLQDSINQVIAQNHLTYAQIHDLVSSINAMAAQGARQDQKLDRIIADLESRPGAGPGGFQPSNLVKETLDKTVQKFEGITVTLVGVQVSSGRVSVYFNVINEGVTEYRNFMAFGAGSFSNGNSSLIVKGQEIAATGVNFAGQTSGGIVRNNLIPGVLYEGHVDFNGVYANLDEIKIVKLGFSQNHLHPYMMATFRLDGQS